MTIKLEVLVGERPEPFDYGNRFAREPIAGGERLKIALNDRPDQWVMPLARTLTGPCHLLYVLHTTRTGASLGRYESPELSLDDGRRFFQQFGQFLSEDSRHDVWLHTDVDNATIVLDRHNLMWAYGPLDAFEDMLVEAGISRVSGSEVPDPRRQAHLHHYHVEWDDAEREVLRAFDWILNPLRQTDVQFIEGAG